MRTDVLIHKQVFRPFENIRMTVPMGSRLVDVAEDYESAGSISVWYERPEVSPGTQQFTLFVVPTGITFDQTNNRASYFKTVHMRNGLVWHLYMGVD